MSEEQASGLIDLGLDDPVRIVFPNLFVPRAVKDKKGKETGAPKYGVTFLLDPQSPDTKALKAKAVEVAKARWPGRALAELAFPFKDGDKEKARSAAKNKDGSFYEASTVLKASTQFPPAVVDGRRNPPAITTDQKLIYSGCYVAAELNFVAYEGVGANPDGVTAYLNSICFVKPGERIAGKDHAATFAKVRGHTVNESVAGDDEDEEIPGL